MDARRVGAEAPFTVAQLGARMHYAVPRVLEAEGALHCFYTDICADAGWPRLLRLVPRPFLPGSLQRLAERVPMGIPLRRIRAFNSFGIEYARRQMRSCSQSEVTATHLWAGRTFCRLVLGGGLEGAGGVYVFNSAGLEILQEARRRGLIAVVEQTIAPRAFEDKILAEEHLRFPDWEPSPEEDKHASEFCAREAAEWGAADLILCGSEFARDGIVSCGGPAERCRVVPYGVDGTSDLWDRLETGRPGGPLHVLTVGSVTLRKGSPYILQAAKLLGNRAIFRMVGAVAVSDSAATELSNHVELAGAVPRSRIAQHYRWAHVLLHPSLCEGSATATYEAMAWGLPVVCTHNAGSVVRDGVEGFIVPVRDGHAIAEKLRQLHSNWSLLEKLAENARRRSGSFTTRAYGDRLLRVLRESM
jgi:glycosyltransferase involved in cell wall biosynthesis